MNVRNTLLHRRGEGEAHVVFPADPVKSDGVDVSIEDQSKGGEKTKNAEALGLDGERENLDGVGTP